MLNFILYSHVDAGNIGDNLGNSDYSYFFVRKEFEPMLARLGKLHFVTDPATQVDAIYDACQQQGDTCLFLSFTPPHKACMTLRCPAICVFAWEVSTIPTKTWDDDERNDWRNVLAEHGRTIVLSEDTARAVKAAMGSDFPVLVLPTPIWDRMAATRQLVQKTNPSTNAHLTNAHLTNAHLANTHSHNSQTAQIIGEKHHTALALPGIIIDSRQMNFSADSLIENFLSEETVNRDLFTLPNMPTPTCLLAADKFLTQVGDYTPYQSINIVKADAGYALYGPYLPWNLGNYVITIYADISTAGLDMVVVDAACAQGETSLGRLEIAASEQAIAAYSEEKKLRHIFCELPIQLDKGCQDLEIRLWVPNNSQGSIYAVEIRPILPSDALSSDADASTPTSLATNVASIPRPANHALTLDGVVYTAVLNPNCGRKNWVDMLTAFCMAFRDTPDATFILKASQKDLDSYYRKILLVLSQLAPFQCRVICINAYLHDIDYSQLIAATSFYVNASTGEGLCIPLLEFLCSGIPAIAPNHTAMADYVEDSFAFIVAAQPEVGSWPHDPLKRRWAFRYRISWESLYQAFTQSYAAAKQPSTYQAMHAAVLQKMSLYASPARSAIALQQFLVKTETPASPTSTPTQEQMA